MFSNDCIDTVFSEASQEKIRFASLALSKDFVASNVTIMYGFSLTLVIIAKHFPDGLIKPVLDTEISQFSFLTKRLEFLNR